MCEWCNYKKMIICCFECDLEVESSTYKTRLCNQNVTNSEKTHVSYYALGELCDPWLVLSKHLQ
jgi:hypothetical protein